MQTKIGYCIKLTEQGNKKKIPIPHFVSEDVRKDNDSNV